MFWPLTRFSEYSESDSAKVLILVAGGAFILGHKGYVTMLCRALRLAGILCIAVDYRYWPQTSIDGMIDDVDSAVQWCFDNASRYGGDPKRISLLICIYCLLFFRMNYMGSGSSCFGVVSVMDTILIGRIKCQNCARHKNVEQPLWPSSAWLFNIGTRLFKLCFAGTSSNLATCRIFLETFLQPVASEKTLSSDSGSLILRAVLTGKGWTFPFAYQ